MSHISIVVLIASYNSFVHEKYGNQKEDIKKTTCQSVEMKLEKQVP